MAVTYKDYYKILGVSREASKDEISKAFKKLARQHHPDLNPGNAAAEDKFKEINEAYEVLKDEEKRRLYDQLGPDWQQGQHFQQGGFGGPGGGNFQFNFNGQNVDGAGFSDFFETLFGGGRQTGGRSGFGADPFGGFSQRPQRGRDIEAELEISLEDAVKGGEKNLTLQAANGEPRTLKVTIPAGIRDGGKLRLNGQGNESFNGGPKGDLYLKVRFARHPEFHVDGNDLIHDVSIFPWEAVLGTKVRVPTLEGAVELSIPPETDSGRKMRLKGKGLGKPGARGDAFVRIGIRTPKHLTDKQRELWEALAAEAAQ